MDGLFHGKPYEQMVPQNGFYPYFWFNTHIDHPIDTPSYCCRIGICGVDGGSMGPIPRTGDWVP